MKSTSPKSPATITSPARAALIEFTQHSAELATDATTIESQISDARRAIADAGKPAQEANQLRAQRRGLLARLFLKEAAVDESEVDTIDSAIKSAESDASRLARMKESAEAGIEILESRLQEVRVVAREHAASHKRLLHAALIEDAQTAGAEFIEAVNRMAGAYAQMAGRCRAADHLSDPASGLMGTSFRVNTLIDPSGLPNFVRLPNTDLLPQILDAECAAKQRIAELA